MARLSAVKEDETGCNLEEKDIFKAGIKKEQPAELTDTEPSVYIMHVLGNEEEI